jgi:uncharacterized membrane protein YdjX (TVP38/TMEM64 family)
VDKVNEFLRRYKKAIINLLLTLAVMILLTAVIAVVLILCGILYYDDGVRINVNIFDSFRNSWLCGLLFIVFQVIITTVLCFLPGTTMTFIVLGQTLFPEPWQAFLMVFSGVVISSTAMYLVGRFGGYKICTKLLGKEDCEKATTLLRNKGTVFFPIMMLFPMFPDDALVMISGTLKMKLSWFFPSIIIGRGVGIATIIFGLSIVPFDKFTEWWHWVLFVILCAVLVVSVFLFALWFNKFMEKRNKK